MLVQQIAPRIRSLLSNSVAQVGSEDIGELAQDGIALAATLLSSAQARGKKLSPGTVSYYAAKLVRQGRRSTGLSTTDVMHPATQIAGRSRMVSLDAPVGTEAEADEPCVCTMCWPHGAQTLARRPPSAWIGHPWSAPWMLRHVRSSSAWSKAGN